VVVNDPANRTIRGFVTLIVNLHHGGELITTVTAAMVATLGFVVAGQLTC